MSCWTEYGLTAGGVKMKSSEEEIRRLQQLRDQQIRERDPTAKKVAQYQRTVSNYRKRQKKITLSSVINDLPAKFLYMVIGTLLGIALAIILRIIINEPWINALGLILTIFGLVSGRVMGAARDWGDEDWL
jgi:hypothetical protein